MSEAKIRLSSPEMELVMNADLILTKNGILEKVNQLFAALQQEQQILIRKMAADLPDVVLQSTAKISKGENYAGLPYRVLDYPRVFGKTDVLAIRTLFWWGHYFSITLQLSGIYKAAAEASIICAYPLLVEKGYYCAVNDDPWQHQVETTAYSPVGDFSPSRFSMTIQERPFLKLTRTIPLSEWEEAISILAGSFEELLGMLTGNASRKIN